MMWMIRMMRKVELREQTCFAQSTQGRRAGKTSNDALTGFLPQGGVLALSGAQSLQHSTHRGARTHDHKVKGLALCRLS